MCTVTSYVQGERITDKECRQSKEDLKCRLYTLQCIVYVM